MGTKICSKCKRELPATTEYFSKDTYKKDGLRCRCKKCCKIDIDKYRLENKTRIFEAHLKYYSKNKERLAKQQRIYRKGNKELYAKSAKYQHENRDKCNIVNQRYLTRKRRLPSSLTAEQWDNIKIHFHNRCAYCGKELPLAQEHFIPLSKGGEYTVNNIIPSCISCNSSKRDKDFFEWYPKFEHYSKKRENAILNFLGYKEDKQQLKII